MQTKLESYWKQKLTSEQYAALREGATEAPFSGDLYTNKADGNYHCAACGQELFSSDTKYESGSGWPSFYDAISMDKIKLVDDYTHGMHRIEVKCANCDSHLGHVFDDGPKDKGGKRYCLNSVCLDFTPEA